MIDKNNQRPTLTINTISGYLHKVFKPTDCGGHYNIFHNMDSPIEWDFLICLRESLYERNSLLLNDIVYIKALRSAVEVSYVDQIIAITDASKHTIDQHHILDEKKGLRLIDIPSKYHVKWALKALSLQRDFILGLIKEYGNESELNLSNMNLKKVPQVA